MNTQKGRVKFKNFIILLDSGYSFIIVMGRLIKQLTPKEYAVMQWNIQSGSITINLKVKIDFTLPKLSATKIMTWDIHGDDFLRADMT